MKLKINGKEYIIIEATKFNEMKKLINEIYENIIVQIEKEIKKNDNKNNV